MTGGLVDTVDSSIPGFHPPHQQRSRETLARITEVIGELLVEAGPAELAVRDLVVRADTSVGAFYARFDDREAALAYASGDFWERSRQSWSAYLAPTQWKGASAASIVAAVIRTFTRIMVADADRTRAFVRLTLSLPTIRPARRIAEHDRYIASTLGALLESRAIEIRHESPRDAAEEGFRRVLAAVRDYVVFDVGGASRPADHRRLILCLCRMYARYLDVHPVPGSYSDLLALAKVGQRNAHVVTARRPA